MAASEATIAATLPLPPTSGRPTTSPDWEGTGSACAAFLNLYKLTGEQQYKTSAQQIADNFIAWNDIRPHESPASSRCMESPRYDWPRANPASKGSVVVLFATGAGQTIPAGVDGVLSNGALPQPVLPVSVTIGGQSAAIAYSGAAPDSVAGVMQINCIVPQSVASGNRNVVLTIGNASSAAGVTLVVR
jgi:hypothetical protein